ncbi:hypothetical protein [Nocardia crassostreae]|uniref:hypothetical protein n=1 Tax=Nocardia crassostreae TaxID=53428 RepID=UPI0008334AA4|nr:hypothetical protein [Nocardia crassostreae]
MRFSDDGVIGHIAPAHPIPGESALPAAVSGILLDPPLGQLPEDVATFEPPAFALSRKEIEQGGSPLSGGTPHGLPGTSQGDDTYAASVLEGPLSPALDAAHNVLGGAQQALGEAQGMLGTAQAALNNVPGALNAAQAALTQAGLNPAALPPLPADPVGDLMKGLALPAIPGMDALFKPFLDLINSFGTGVLGQLNPASLLSQGSKLIEGAMSVGQGAFKTVEQLWQGQASRNAQAAGQQAQNHGQETTQRGFDISAVTEQAAAVVQRGNIQLTAIAQSFAAQATALAPVIMTPPAQTALIASATQHLGSAMTVVNITRGELAGYTAQLNGVVAQLLGQGGGPNPAEVAQSLAQNVGQPILEQAKGLLQGGGSPTGPFGSDPTRTGPSDVDTKAAGLGGGGGGAGGGGLGGGGLGGVASTPGGPGSSIPGGKTPAGAASPFGTGTGGLPGMGGAGSPGFMGSPHAAGAGQRGSDQEYSRTVVPHQSRSGESELTGNLGDAAPNVIGETEDEVTGDYETDQS